MFVSLYFDISSLFAAHLDYPEYFPFICHLSYLLIFNCLQLFFFFTFRIHVSICMQFKCLWLILSVNPPYADLAMHLYRLLSGGLLSSADMKKVVD